MLFVYSPFSAMPRASYDLMIVFFVPKMFPTVLCYYITAYLLYLIVCRPSPLLVENAGGRLPCTRVIHIIFACLHNNIFFYCIVNTRVRSA